MLLLNLNRVYVVLFYLHYRHYFELRGKICQFVVDILRGFQGALLLLVVKIVAGKVLPST